MPNMTYQAVVVSGIDDESGEGIVAAHAFASELFEADLLSAMTPIGHNGLRSFCIFPSGSGNLRPAQVAHRDGIETFFRWCAIQERSALDYVGIHWSDEESPTITGSHGGV